MRFTWVAVACLALQLAAPRVSCAQATSHPPATSSNLRLAPELSLDPMQLAQLEEKRAQRRQRRARRVLTAGVAITGSALIHTIWAASVRSACGGEPERRGLHTDSLFAAGAAGAVGISLTFVGGFRWAAAKPAASTMDRKERAILGLLGIGAAAITQALLGMVRLADNGFCAS